MEFQKPNMYMYASMFQNCVLFKIYSAVLLAKNAIFWVKDMLHLVSAEIGMCQVPFQISDLGQVILSGVRLMVPVLVGRLLSSIVIVTTVVHSD